MAINYYKMFDLINRKKMTREELRIMTGLSSSTMSKMSANGAVSTVTIDKICKALKCQPGDILEYVDDEGKTPVTTRKKVKAKEVIEAPESLEVQGIEEEAENPDIRWSDKMQRYMYRHDNDDNNWRVYPPEGTPEMPERLPFY